MVRSDCFPAFALWRSNADLLAFPAARSWSLFAFWMLSRAALLGLRDFESRADFPEFRAVSNEALAEFFAACSRLSRAEFRTLNNASLPEFAVC